MKIVPYVFAVVLALLIGCGYVSDESYQDTTQDDEALSSTGAYVPVWQRESDLVVSGDEVVSLKEALTTPPPGPVVTHPEWSTAQGVLLRWPIGWPELRDTYTSMLAELQTQGIVYIVVSNRRAKNSAIADIETCSECSMTNIEWVTARTNTIWMRDYGPEFMFYSNDSALGIVDLNYGRTRRKDDAFPKTFATTYDINYYTPNLALAGGNFQVDGNGNCFTSKYTAEINDESFTRTVFRDYFGCTNTYFIDYLAEEGTHHIDMWMHFLTPTKVIVGDHTYYGDETLSYPDDVNDGILDDIADQLLGLGYDVVRIPQPASRPSPFDGYTIVTYTNSNIVNNRILVPVYGLATDDDALSIYEDILSPSAVAVGIDSNYIIDYGGAMHCITMEKH